MYQTLRQGIFTMDEAFLRGYGMDAARTLVKAGFVERAAEARGF